ALDVPGDRERREATEDRDRPPVEVLVRNREPEVREAVEEGHERYLRLEACERRAEAVVRPASEPTWLVCSRPRSSASASGNCLSSRFADPTMAMTRSPRRITCPPSSTSLAAHREIVRSTGLSQRRSSSTATETRAGLARSKASWSRCESRA